MWRLLILSMTVTIALTRTPESSRGIGTATRVYRQNLYNYRPMSTLIEDENEYRSYDNTFSEGFVGGSRDRDRDDRDRDFDVDRDRDIHHDRDRDRGDRGRSGRAYNSHPNPPLSLISNRNFRPYHSYPGADRDRDRDEDDYGNVSDQPDDDDVEDGRAYNFRPPGGGSSRNPPPLPPLPPLAIVPRPGTPPYADLSGPARGDSTYAFGYDLYDQSRHEQSDPFGNVNGDFSFVDDEGNLRKVTYMAGAHKGFVVNSGSFPSSGSSSSGSGSAPPRQRPSIKKLQDGTTTVIRRISSHNNGNHGNQQRPDDEGHGGGAGIGINVGSSNSNNNNNNIKDNSNSNSNNNSNGNSNSNDGTNKGDEGGVKPWGALGQNGRRMRKRKPAIVVKVKRPISNNNNQHNNHNNNNNNNNNQPAWMYYRPPNPGRPVSSSGGSSSSGSSSSSGTTPGENGGSGWVSSTKKQGSTTTTTIYPTGDNEGDSGADGWSDVENEIPDPYPKDKSYSFGYNTGDQTRQEVSDAFGNIKGSYSFVDPNGVHRTVHYTAGHSGFKVLNAQPSILRPVYADAPSLPYTIPVAVTSVSSPIPQPSAIVYHIHPDGGVGVTDWKPWESSRISPSGKSSRYTSSSSNANSSGQKRRSGRHRSSSSSSSSSTAPQPNSFHLTHTNRKFYPSYSNIYDMPKASASSSSSSSRRLVQDLDLDVETFRREASQTYPYHSYPRSRNQIHRYTQLSDYDYDYFDLEHDPQFIKHIQQQIRQSNKLRKLRLQQQQFQQQHFTPVTVPVSVPVFQYNRRSYSSPPPRPRLGTVLQNRLNLHASHANSNSHGHENAGEESHVNPAYGALALDDQQFSDYEAASGTVIVQSNPVSPSLDRGNSGKSAKLQMEKKSGEDQNSKVKKSGSNSNSSKNSHGEQEHLDGEKSTTGNDNENDNKMMIEGEPDIQAYSGGYGEKNPLLVISESSIRQQRQATTTASALASVGERPPSPGSMENPVMASMSTVTSSKSSSVVSKSSEQSSTIPNSNSSPTPNSSPSPTSPSDSTSSTSSTSTSPSSVGDNHVAESNVQPAALALVLPSELVAEMKMKARKGEDERTSMTPGLMSMEMQGGHGVSAEKGKDKDKSEASKKKPEWISPASLLAKKMASAPVSKMSQQSISAITIPMTMSNSGRLMHYPGGKLDHNHSASSSSKETQEEN